MSSTVSVPQTPRFCTHHLHVKRIATPIGTDDDHYRFELRIRRKRYRLLWCPYWPDRLRLAGGSGDVADILSAAARAYVLRRIFEIVEFPTHLQPATPATTAAAAAAAWEVAR